MTFGKYLRSLRVTKGVSQKKLAEEGGIDFTYLSKIENDRMPPPSEEVLKKMAAFLGEDENTLILKARKIPSQIKEMIIEEQKVPEFLRSVQRTDKTVESESDIAQIIKNIPQAAKFLKAASEKKLTSQQWEKMMLYLEEI